MYWVFGKRGEGGGVDLPPQFIFDISTVYLLKSIIEKFDFFEIIVMAYSLDHYPLLLHYHK